MRVGRAVATDRAVEPSEAAEFVSQEPLTAGTDILRRRSWLEPTDIGVSGALSESVDSTDGGGVLSDPTRG